LLTSAIIPPINHLLRQANWAREKLRTHVGKTARILVSPFAFSLAITDKGEVAAANDGEPDVMLSLTPPVLIRILARDESAMSDVEIVGDAAFAADINFVVSHLSYDAEEDLSRIVGDVAAHRMAGAGRDILAWQKSVFENFAAAGAEFLTFERPLLVDLSRVQKFIAEIDDMRDAVARLEKRIEKLESRQGM